MYRAELVVGTKGIRNVFETWLRSIDIVKYVNNLDTYYFNDTDGLVLSKKTKSLPVPFTVSKENNEDRYNDFVNRLSHNRDKDYKRVINSLVGVRHEPEKKSKEKELVVLSLNDILTKN